MYLCARIKVCEAFTNHNFFFNVLLTVYLCIILYTKPTWCTIFLSMFISFLYMFWATMCLSSGEITVCDTWYLSLCETNTKCHIDTVISPDDGHSCPKHERKEINTLRKIVHQVGFIYKITIKPCSNSECFAEHARTHKHYIAKKKKNTCSCMHSVYRHTVC